jgi:hypothetical protein
MFDGDRDVKTIMCKSFNKITDAFTAQPPFPDINAMTKVINELNVTVDAMRQELSDNRLKIARLEIVLEQSLALKS